MHISDLKIDEVTFTHQDTDTGKYTTFAVERIMQFIVDNPEAVTRALIPVDKEFGEHIRKHRGLEAHRLLRLLEAKTISPIILTAMPDGTHLILDGNHRYYIASAAGAQFIPAFLLTHEQVTPYIVDGVDDRVSKFCLEGHSGIE